MKANSNIKKHVTKDNEYMSSFLSFIIKKV